VNLEPKQAALAERPPVGKEQQAAAEVRADVVQVRRDRVGTPAKVERMRKVKRRVDVLGRTTGRTVRAARGDATA